MDEIGSLILNEKGKSKSYRKKKKTDAHKDAEIIDLKGNVFNSRVSRYEGFCW